jgi:hypothetical protein
VFCVDNRGEAGENENEDCFVVKPKTVRQTGAEIRSRRFCVELFLGA